LGAGHELALVEGLKKGRCTAPDHAPVQPVPDEVVDETLKFLGPVVADMVRFQRLTGARPGEICLLRPMDVETSSEIWIYRPESHKTEHHGRERIVVVGPQAQDILRPYLLRQKSSHVFSPQDSERKRRAAEHEARKTPLGYGNRPGTNRRKSRTRTASDRYSPSSYRRAISRACDKLNDRRKEEAAKRGEEAVLIETWSPNQLRHTAATRIRKEFGLEASQIILGHASADVTQVYAERDLQRTFKVAAKIG